MGAVPGRGLLRLSSSQSLFDVERFRSEASRVALVREVSRPTLVLGSTQPTGLTGSGRVRRREVELARRRGGGGAVYLEPGDQLWLDAWIPRDDPLWKLDVSAAAEWVGAWWIDCAGGARTARLRRPRRPRRARRLGELVCFAGRGPGEVFHGGRKVVGLSQWRAREGALFSSCAYLRWDPAPLLELVHFDEHVRAELARDLRRVAVGLSELDPPVGDLAACATACSARSRRSGWLRPDGDTPGVA